ncbi:hypothetical protein D9757_002629 [Collybiopsis confluens]|uniref:Amidohydrolase-related domain-containing protein n=1 Tax=Collybiopsis confluens TaxID=2823264 RepID=A0A8H5HW19_9AGAR|nr:hypothetical protein D9757_002629 [Collybiopsis confluens]
MGSVMLHSGDCFMPFTCSGMELAIRYASLLRTRPERPRIVTRVGDNGQKEDRLVILRDEPSGGRPIGPSYTDRNEKLKFMQKHGIDVSIVSTLLRRLEASTANPWLDFLSADQAHDMALKLNQDLEDYCSSGPNVPDSPTPRLYGFGLLPLVPGIDTQAILEAVRQISALPHLKGVIIGTVGVGRGLDDEALAPIWAAIESAGLTVFLHPHYGVGNVWGEKDNGHVLPLALGFPFETTVATTRLILSGAFDRFPNLRVLLAHSGGSLPQLSSRLASCIAHDPIVASRLKHDARYYLGKMYFDAVAYGPEELGFVCDVINRSNRFEGDAQDVALGSRSIGSNRMLFGTEKWMSVVENLDAIDSVKGWAEEDRDGPSSDGYKLITLDIIQHDDISPSVNGLVGFCFRLHLHIEKQTESSDNSSLIYSCCY